MQFAIQIWCEIFGFFSPLVPSKPEKNILVLLSLYIFFREVCSFQFLNDEIHNYVKKKHDCEFYPLKLKSKQTSFKKYTN